MKKTLPFIVFLALILGCEKDDFCTQNPITPKLVVRFYDSNNPSQLKTVDQLYVWANGKDSIIVNQTLDSISIPLNSIANETVYNFSKGTIVNQLTIKYTPKEMYVSRSCGFRVIFDEVTVESNNTWISSISQIQTTINNQNAAHVQIFH